MKLYAFTTPEIAKHNDYLKIGETNGDVEKQLYQDEIQRQALCDKFYLELRNWYFWATEKSNDPDYSLRIIIRLLLCFFLKEKQLVPKELFDEEFIKENLKENKEFRYYNAILRNLFFHCLNTPQQDRNEYEHQKFIKNIRNVKDQFQKIPFLNGGLFYEYEGDDFTLNDDYFFSELQTRHISELDGNYKVEGIIKILSQYQYKLSIDDLLDLDKEYTPTVDPEFIDKVFESLLACIDADTKENKRKTTGSFYTPKEIVDYMVSESLDAYLKNDSGNDLLQCKILDPACGSGAFPCGVINEIMRRFDPNKTMTQTERYRQKLKILQNVIYGVDIQPIAVQITVLRLFLSLIQEIVPDKKKDNYGIEPLPNLETKFICANTLIGLAKENKGFFVSPSIKIAVEMLKNNRDQYVTANTTQDKQKIQEYDKKLRGSFSQLLETEAIFSYDTTERLLKWNPYDQTVSADFFDPQWMFGVEKFDIVIGNPPYIAISEKEQKIFFQEKYSEVLSGHYDLYIFFFKRGIDLLKKNGVSTFITPHTFTQYKQFLNLRKWLYENARILEITGRIEYLFKLAMVDSAITILSKSNSQVRTRFTNFVYENLKLQKISEFQLNSNEYSYDSFDIVNINNKNIIKKFYTGSKQLYEVVDSSQGITVYAKVQGKKINYFNNKCISTHSKKCTKGREICKYNIKWSTTYIEYGNWLWCPRNLKFFDAPKIFLRQTSADLIATYIEESMCCIDSVHSLIQKDTSINLKYILGILNSKFGSYLYHLLISEVGKVLAQVKLNFLRQIPIKNISPNDQQPIIALVNQILLSKKENSEADTLELETEIDRLVYKLYDLTSEEIKIIETAEKTKSK